MRKYFIIIGILLFVFILGTIDLNLSLQILLGAKLEYVVLAVIFLIASIALKAVKWGMIINAHQPSFEYWKWILTGMKYFLIGFSLSLLTPARVGDFSRAMYLRNIMKTGTAISTVLIDRIIDVGLLLSLGGTAILVFSALMGIIVIPVEILLLIITIFLAGLYFFTRKHWVEKLVRPFFKIIVPKKYQEKLKLSFNDMYASLQTLREKKLKLAMSVIWGVMSWFLIIVAVYFLGISIGIPVTLFGFMFILVPVSNLLDILPVSISGIGTREAAFVFLLSFFMISAEMAVAFSVLYLITGYLLFGLIGALLLSANPIRLNSIKGSND